MKEAETLLTAEMGESKAQLARLDAQARDLQEKLRVTEAEHGQLGVRLEQASRDLATSREENKELLEKEKVRREQPTSQGQRQIFFLLNTRRFESGG